MGYLYSLRYGRNMCREFFRLAAILGMCFIFFVVFLFVVDFFFSSCLWYDLQCFSFKVIRCFWLTLKSIFQHSTKNFLVFTNKFELLFIMMAAAAAAVAAR